jgi:hypothetical protein
MCSRMASGAPGRDTHRLWAMNDTGQLGTRSGEFPGLRELTPLRRGSRSVSLSRGPRSRSGKSRHSRSSFRIRVLHGSASAGRPRSPAEAARASSDGRSNRRMVCPFRPTRSRIRAGSAPNPDQALRQASACSRLSAGTQAPNTASFEEMAEAAFLSALSPPERDRVLDCREREALERTGAVVAESRHHGSDLLALLSAPCGDLNYHEI